MKINNLYVLHYKNAKIKKAEIVAYYQYSHN